MLGDRALDFFRWFTKSKFQLMADFLEDIGAPPGERDAAVLTRRFEHAIRHAKRVLLARLGVTALLAAGIVATVSAAVASTAPIPALYAQDVDVWLAWLDRVAAISGSATVVLLAIRLGFDRYLDLVDTSATFIAMQLATARCADRA